ncbi:MAG: DegV family protein [Thermaerobacter sp.]|nr:DegV family protein [Thermaerobacter sp.]
MTQKVAIVSDSTFDLPDDLIERLKITVAPLHVLGGGKDYLDRIDITIEEANRLMLEGNVRLTTAAASAADFLGAMEKAQQIAPSLVVLSISPVISATYNSAKTAIELLEGDADVSLFETRTVTASQGLLAEHLAELALRGADKAEVCSAAERLIDRVRMVVTTQTAAYTKQGGRYSQEEGGRETDDGNPVFRVWEKGWREIDRAPNRAASLERLIELMKADLEALGYQPGDKLRVAVDHVVCEDDAQALKRRVEEVFNPSELGIWQMAPTAAAHLGPGTIGIAYLHEGAPT